MRRVVPPEGLCSPAAEERERLDATPSPADFREPGEPGVPPPLPDACSDEVCGPGLLACLPAEDDVCCLLSGAGVAVLLVATEFPAP